jgi:hypothetical protein
MQRIRPVPAEFGSLRVFRTLLLHLSVFLCFLGTSLRAEVDVTPGCGDDSIRPVTDWGGWTKFDSYPGLEVRGRISHYNQFAKQYDWDLEFYNGYDEPLTLSFIALDVDEAFKSTAYRFTIPPRSTKLDRINFLDADCAGEFFVYVDRVVLGEEPLEPLGGGETVDMVISGFGDGSNGNGGNSGQGPGGPGGEPPTEYLPPIIITQPQSQTIQFGLSALFQVVADSRGDSGMEYQWIIDGLAEPFVSNRTSYRVTPVFFSRPINVQVLVRNQYGAVFSDVATLTLVPPPAPPQWGNVDLSPLEKVSDVAYRWWTGSELTLPLSTSEDETFYRWYRNDVLLPDQTGKTLRIASFDNSAVGSYRAEIGNNHGVTQVTPRGFYISAKARVAPRITGQPLSTAAVLGTSVRFVVSAEGPDLNYAWSRGGTPVGTNSPILDIPVVSASNVGDYQVVVTNDRGTATSEIASLALAPLPALTGWDYAPGSQHVFTTEYYKGTGAEREGLDVTAEALGAAPHGGQLLKLTHTGNRLYYGTRRIKSNTDTTPTSNYALFDADGQFQRWVLGIENERCFAMDENGAVYSVRTVNPGTVNFRGGLSLSVTRSLAGYDIEHVILKTLPDGTVAWARQIDFVQATHYIPPLDKTRQLFIADLEVAPDGSQVYVLVYPTNVHPVWNGQKTQRSNASFILSLDGASGAEERFAESFGGFLTDLEMRGNGRLLALLGPVSTQGDVGVSLRLHRGDWVGQFRPGWEGTGSMLVELDPSLQPAHYSFYSGVNSASVIDGPRGEGWRLLVFADSSEGSTQIEGYNLPGPGGYVATYQENGTLESIQRISPGGSMVGFELAARLPDHGLLFQAQAQLNGAHFNGESVRPGHPFLLRTDARGTLQWIRELVHPEDASITPEAAVSGAPLRGISWLDTSATRSRPPLPSTLSVFGEAYQFVTTSWEWFEPRLPVLVAENGATSRSVMVGESLELTASVGGPNTTLRWERNGTPVPGANAATLTLGTAETGEAGEYSLVATYGNETVRSNPIDLQILSASAPVFLRAPESREISSFADAVFEVEVAGAQQLRWELDGRRVATADGRSRLVLEGDSLNPGLTTRTFSVTAIATNSQGTTRRSAALTVRPGPNFYDNLALFKEQFGAWTPGVAKDPWVNFLSDYNNDGMIDWVSFAIGLDPRRTMFGEDWMHVWFEPAGSGYVPGTQFLVIDTWQSTEDLGIGYLYEYSFDLGQSWQGLTIGSQDLVEYGEAEGFVRPVRMKLARSTWNGRSSIWVRLRVQIAAP